MNVHFLDDDYATNRYHEITLNTVAQELNMELTFFSDPEDLLENYVQTKKVPDVLFCDVNMPTMKCWELVERFTKLLPDAKTEFVLLTTALDPIISEKAQEYPMIKDITTKFLGEDYLRTYKPV